MTVVNTYHDSSQSKRNSAVFMLIAVKDVFQMFEEKETGLSLVANPVYHTCLVIAHQHGTIGHNQHINRAAPIF